MKNVRTLFWRNALRHLRGGRPVPAPVAPAIREERLRAVATLGATEDGALALSAWRGRSGRRYVVAAHPLARADAGDCDGAVLLAVVRNAEGVARIVATATGDGLPDEARRRAWLARAARRGAQELHVHRLAETPVERRAVRSDLGALPPEPGGDRRDARGRRGAGGCSALDRGPAEGADAPRRSARGGVSSRGGFSSRGGSASRRGFSSRGGSSSRGPGVVADASGRHPGARADALERRREAGEMRVAHADLDEMSVGRDDVFGVHA